MKKIVLLLLLFTLSQPLLATSIVVLITSQYIIIGADSKRMIIDAEKSQTTTETACKIRMVNNFCFAAAGLTASAATGFSVDQIVQKELRKKTTAANAVSRIQRAVVRALKKELQFQKQNHPKQYARLMETKQHLLEIVVLQVANNVPQAFIIGFEAVDGTSIQVTSYTASCAAGCATTAPKLLLLGEYSAMENYLQAPVLTNDPVMLVNQMLLTQARITPGTVGSPFSLLKLNASGIEWLNPHCN